MAKGCDTKWIGGKGLVPVLRFPEFKKEWEIDMMQSMFDMKNGYTPSKSNSEYWNDGTIPWFRLEDIRKNGHILSDSIQHVTPQAIKNSSLFPAYSIIVATTATIGEHALIIVDSLANQQFTFLTKRKSFEDKIDMMYFHHYMFVIDEWCKKNTNSGGLISVNMPAFKQLLIPFPSPDEQSKIAGCLSSIDEEINAMKEKVEELKTHKKGLVQKLFPIIGKFLPEVRFHDFSTNWEVDFMQNIFDMKNGYTPSKSNPEYWNDGTIPWFRMDDIRKNGHILSDSIQHVTPQAIKNSGLFPAYSIIVATTATIGEHALIIVDSLANQRFTFLTKRKSFEDKIDMMYFHHYMFVIDEWCKKNTNSGGLISVNMPAFKQLLIPFPSPDEQSKIAGCLSSIDELISLYEGKVILLEQHKKGLMQQLFLKL